MRLRDEEGGAIQVFEAIIVAVIILTAVLFFTTLQRPTQAPDVGGVDLAVLAGDILVVLEQRTFTDPDDNMVELDLTQWIDRVMQGDEVVADDVHTFMQGVLGGATKYEIRLDNGIAPLRLIPFGEPQVPLAAKGAASFIIPEWDVNNSVAPDYITWPGGPIFHSPTQATADCSTWSTVWAPTGNRTGPDGDDAGVEGDPWVAHWQGVCDPAQTNGQRLAPSGIPFGKWSFVNATCPTGCILEVTLPPDPTDGSLAGRAKYPIYGVELLLWRGG